MESHVDAAIRRSLRPSEQVLWTEGRRATHATVVGRLVGVALLLSWDVFCVLVLGKTIQAEGPFVEELFSETERSSFEKVNGGPTLPMLEFVWLMLFGFVLTVLVAVVWPRRDRLLAYVVTDQPILTFGGFWRPKLQRSIPVEVLRPEHVVLGRDGSGRGTITFRDHAWTDDHGKHAPSWEQLSDAPAVLALILRTIDQRERESPDVYPAVRLRTEPGTDD